MRCYACNNILTPAESTRKFKLSGEYPDLCNPCLESITDNNNPHTETVEGEGLEEEDFDDDEESREEY